MEEEVKFFLNPYNWKGLLYILLYSEEDPTYGMKTGK